MNVEVRYSRRHRGYFVYVNGYCEKYFDLKFFAVRYAKRRAKEDLPDPVIWTNRT